MISTLCSDKRAIFVHAYKLIIIVQLTKDNRTMDVHRVDLFQELNSEMINQLLHSCADDICGYPPTSTYQQIANGTNLGEDVYNSVHAMFTSILRTPGALYLDPENMPQSYYNLPEHVRSEVMSCLKVRQEQLTAALLREHSKKYVTIMTDFDYRLKLVMGSSKLASLREPLLELDLMIEDAKDKRILSLEMSKEELDSLINALESSNR